MTGGSAETLVIHTSNKKKKSTTTLRMETECSNEVDQTEL